MISYEIILSSAILIIILLSGSLNYITIIEIQQSIWFIVPLLPVFIFYFIAVLAETSRTPFDLQEANPVLYLRFGLYKFHYMLETSKTLITHLNTINERFIAIQRPSLFK
jgi:NADH dehydrogenase